MCIINFTVSSSLLPWVFSFQIELPPSSLPPSRKFLANSPLLKQVMLVKAISCAHDILVEELQKLSKAINQPIDIKDVTSEELFGFTGRSHQEVTDAEASEQVSSKPNGVLEVVLLFEATSHYESPLAPQTIFYFYYFCNLHILCFYSNWTETKWRGWFSGWWFPQLILWGWTTQVIWFDWHSSVLLMEYVSTLSQVCFFL